MTSPNNAVRRKNEVLFVTVPILGTCFMKSLQTLPLFVLWQNTYPTRDQTLDHYLFP